MDASPGAVMLAGLPTNENNSEVEVSLEETALLDGLSSASATRMCKFCYSDELVNDTWRHPCRCSGSMKWVHGRCFAQWLRKAPPQQQNQCQTCRFTYKKHWVMKNFSDWCRPPLRLSGWEILEILLDGYSTFKFIRGIIWTIDGKRSFLVQLAHFCFWRMFIATDRRMAYYSNLSRTLMSSVFDISVKDFSERDNHINRSTSTSELALAGP
ncbi:unnamed protein product, partial [Mesorhabditis spiculigera]